MDERTAKAMQAHAQTRVAETVEALVAEVRSVGVRLTEVETLLKRHLPELATKAAAQKVSKP